MAHRSSPVRLAPTALKRESLPLSLRGIALLLSLCIAAAIGAAGCKASRISRSPRTAEQLLAARGDSDRKLEELQDQTAAQVLRRAKEDHDAFVSGKSKDPAVVDVLVISGGGDWGAFAAGFLKGWDEVEGELAKPQFDIVTGVSTGALIAPFAFLGDAESTEVVVQTYRNPKKDWVKKRGVISVIRGDYAFATIPGLERDLKLSLDKARIQRIADEAAQGRSLLVNTTNVDYQEMRMWDVTEEATAAVQSGDSSRIFDILLASAALPGIFPPRKIDDGLYVDGGVTGNILWGGPRARSDEDSLVANWLKAYPGVPIPRLRYWIIFNNEVRWPPAVVPGKWSSVLGASMTAGTRAATLNSMRLLVAQARYAQLRHNADIEVRLVAVPDGWVAPEAGTFKKKSMNALADLGEKMGADPASWRTSILLQD